MRKFINISSWVLLSAVIVVSLGFSAASQGEKVCSAIQINIDHSGGNYFVEEDDIKSMIFHEADQVVGLNMTDIYTEKLEYKINNHPAISNVEIYKSIDGELVVDVRQRTPIVRIFSSNGDSFYIDSTGRVMPPSAKFTSRVFVANGFIYETFLDVHHLNLRKDIDSLEENSLMNDIFRFAEFIRKDAFWKAQIEQLYVNKEYDIELIPRVGNHRIVFGDAEELAEKFNKLKIFYSKGLNKTGWNEYSVINLKYANQVVCKKR